MRNNLLEMLIHTPLNSHKNPNRILFIGDEVSLYNHEISKQKFLNLEISYINSFKELQNLESSIFDIVVIDKFLENSEKFYAHLNRVLTDKGLLSLNSLDLKPLELVAKEFLIAMPYFLYCFDNSSKTMIFASKFYHPTADIILQRSDFIDNLNYYNSDIHLSSFICPNWIKTKIKDIVKN